MKKEAINVLVERLPQDEDLILEVMDALISQAQKHESKMGGYVQKLVPMLSHDNPNVSAATASCLGYIGTKSAKEALYGRLAFMSEKELKSEAEFSGWASTTVCYWFVHAIGENRNEVGANIFLSILESPEFSDETKGTVIGELAYFNFGNLKVSVSPKVFELVSNMALSSNKQLAKNAIRLLGEL